MISVIIPVHKDHEYLQTCLESVRAQTYDDVQIVIVEDVDSLGACHTRNKGFDIADGEYLFFCDVDVILDPTCLQKMIDNIEGYEWVYCNYMIGTEPHNYGEFNLQTLKRRNLCSTMSLIKRNAFPGWDNDIERFQDWDLFLNMALNGGKGKWLNQPLFWTPKKDGISTKGNKRVYKKIIRDKWKI